jgi:predicted transcriptional regulator
MDHVISARLDAQVVEEIGRLAGLLHTTRKAVLEQAIRDLAAKVSPGAAADVFEATSGAWSRDDTPDETVQAMRQRSRAAFARRRP